MDTTDLFNEELLRDEGDVVGIGVEASPDEPVDPHDFSGWIWVPERVFARILGLGGIYRQHILTTTDLYGFRALEAQQAARLVDELALVSEIVNDPLVHKYGAMVARVAKQCRRSGQWLLIEGP